TSPLPERSRRLGRVLHRVSDRFVPTGPSTRVRRASISWIAAVRTRPRRTGSFGGDAVGLSCPDPSLHAALLPQLVQRRAWAPTSDRSPQAPERDPPRPEGVHR